MSRSFPSFLLLFSFVALAAAGGWWFGHRHSHAPAAASGERKVSFYQSPMHPWIKSDEPGNCTICGMKLTPVYEGEAGVEAGGGQTVRLASQTASVVNIETTEVTRAPLGRLIRVAGQIDDDESRHRRLSAYVEARIDKLFVNYVGAEVTEGQPLAALYSRDLIVARGEYAIALQQPQSRQRDITIAASEQKLRRMGLTPAQIKKLPGETGDTFDIVAPASGTVVERMVYEGQYVKEGDPLFEIGDFSQMWFIFDAYERDLAWLRVGQTVEVTTPSVPGKVFTAPVAFIDPNLQPATRTAKVRVILDNPLVGDPAKHRRELLHKVYAEGRIRVETDPLLTVPRSAVLASGADPLVYVVKGEREYEPRRVTLGRAGDNVWEVLAGVEEGERIVTTGNLLIDAQAQLEMPSPAPAVRIEELSETQLAAAQALFTSAAAVGEALAADNLEAHNAQIAELQKTAMEAAKELGDDGQRLGAVAHVEPAADLKTARVKFYPLSMVVAELAMALRSQITAVKVFECPMAKSAVPSAETNQGRWIQLAGTIRNPFFGAEMLECGAEVKP